MQCVGRTNSFERCRNSAPIYYPFCRHHRLQALGAFVSLSAAIGVYVGIYTDLVKPRLAVEAIQTGLAPPVQPEPGEEIDSLRPIADARGQADGPALPVASAQGDDTLPPGAPATRLADAVCVTTTGEGAPLEAHSTIVAALQKAGAPVLIDADRCRVLLELRVEAEALEEEILGTTVLRTHARVAVTATDQESGELLFQRLSPRRANTLQDRSLASAEAVRAATESLLAEHPEMLSNLIDKTRGSP